MANQVERSSAFTLYILSKKPSYSSSIIFHSPVLRPPTRAILFKSCRRFIYFCTCLVDNPIDSAICAALTCGSREISLYILRLAFTNSFANCGVPFTNSFTNSSLSFSLYSCIIKGALVGVISPTTPSSKFKFQSVT